MKLIETIKENKGAIAKKALIIGGTIVGLTAGAILLTKNKDHEAIDDVDYEIDYDNDIEDISTDDYEESMEERA